MAASSALPFYGAIVTNCDLDRSRAKGASQWGTRTQLHVSGGDRQRRRFYPVRFLLAGPEATIADAGGSSDRRPVTSGRGWASPHPTVIGAGLENGRAAPCGERR